jgi:hypothetical protein
MMKPGDLGGSTSLSALWVMRGRIATCLFETSRRAEATVFRTRLNLKENNVGLSFYGDYINQQRVD